MKTKTTVKANWAWNITRCLIEQDKFIKIIESLPHDYTSSVAIAYHYVQLDLFTTTSLYLYPGAF